MVLEMDFLSSASSRSSSLSTRSRELALTFTSQLLFYYHHNHYFEEVFGPVSLYLTCCDRNPESGISLSSLWSSRCRSSRFSVSSIFFSSSSLFLLLISWTRAVSVLNKDISWLSSVNRVTLIRKHKYNYFSVQNSPSYPSVPHIWSHYEAY